MPNSGNAIFVAAPIQYISRDVNKLLQGQGTVNWVFL